MLHDKTNKKILEELDQLVYGHERAKKSLISLINRSKLRHLQKWGQLLPEEALIKPSKCLLIGDSGTGKTHLVRSLSKIANFPLLIVDGSSFNPLGASGGIKPETLKSLIISTAKDYYDAKEGICFSLDAVLDQMVVFVDEFDKISGHHDGSSTGNWNEHLQTNFLSIFENNDVLAGVSWIFAGAFSGIGERAKKSMGFNPSIEESKAPEISDEDVVKYGMLPELVGRLTAICKLDKLTEVDFYKILVDKIMPAKIMELSYFNIDDIDISDYKLKEIAKNASNSSQGVRFLYREIEKHFLDIEFNYEDIKIDK